MASLLIFVPAMYTHKGDCVKESLSSGLSFPVWERAEGQTQREADSFSLHRLYKLHMLSVGNIMTI